MTYITDLLVLRQVHEHGHQVRLEVLHFNCLSKLSQLSTGCPVYYAKCWNDEEKQNSDLRTMGVSSWQRFLNKTLNSAFTGAETLNILSMRVRKTYQVIITNLG